MAKWIVYVAVLGEHALHKISALAIEVYWFPPVEEAVAIG